MSRMRKEVSLVSSDTPCMDYESSYFRVLQSVSARRSLIHGKLHEGHKHCAIGCTFDDGVDVLPTRVIDEIAEYNDSFPKLTPYARWKKVRSWLKFKTDLMRKKAKA